MNIKTTLLVFLIGFGNSLSDRNKKIKSEEKFQPSREWKEIKEGQKVPSGLHYRINLSTGKKEAKILDENEQNQLESTSFTMKDMEDSDEDEETFIFDKVESLLKEVNKKNPEADMPKKFRTLDELKKDLGDIQLQAKTDMEILKELFTKFEDEQKKKQIDEKVILSILQDLKYLGHQIDNGNEFYNLDGFRKIIYKELNSTSLAIKQEGLKLFSVLAQNNPKVKVHILETGGITTLLRILNLENNSSVKKSALTALSCTLRTFPYAQNNFVEIGGLTILTELFKTEPVKLKLKIVTLLNDLIIERQKDGENFERHQLAIDIEKLLFDLNWCNHLNELLHDLIIIDASDFASIEDCLLAMKSMLGNCKGLFKSDLILKLHKQYSSLAEKNKGDTDNYFQYLSDVTFALADNNVSNNANRVEL